MVLSTFLQAIATIASMLLNLYIWILIIATLLSWVRPDPYNPIVQVLYRLSEPVFTKVRGLIPTNIGGLDLAPLIVIVALKFIDLTFIRILENFAQGMR
ncbi:YggT family protein [uncultured Helicobacter sp.]|uniref:YggT family protein n=1 Tax=uncultured Helicobacter sp. TaxID=175537 RepID=UPI0037506C6F